MDEKQGRCLTPDEVAEILGVDVSMVYRNRDDLFGFKVGGVSASCLTS
jgi:hypothetical protein